MRERGEVRVRGETARSGLAVAIVLAAAFVAACGDDGEQVGSPPPTATPTPILVSVSGDAIPFVGGPDGRIEGAEVWILEQAARRVTTGADGHFEFDGLAVGSEITLVMEHPDYYPIQTGTIIVGPAGAERVTFQAVTYEIYDAFAEFLDIDPDPTRCQMVTTVTRVGKSIYDPGAHGESGAVVTLDPPLPAEQGPLYFNASVLPDWTLTETSEDGGVLFLQVPPGEYVWTASKPGVEFSQVRMKCRAGLLVNASPPWGLQAQ
jgi:hypothetical protein